MPELRLPPRGSLSKSGADDPVDFYYKPLTRTIYRARLRLALRLLGDRRYGSLLEVGYGSGIFLVELSAHTNRLVGVDIHGEGGNVAAALGALGAEVDLVRGSIEDLPFADRAFDAVVCLSVLEHLNELDRPLTEIRRVLVPEGVAALGFPARNFVTDTFFRLAGYDPRALHPSDDREILAAARRAHGLELRRLARIPGGYVGCLLEAV